MSSRPSDAGARVKALYAERPELMALLRCVVELGDDGFHDGLAELVRRGLLATHGVPAEGLRFAHRVLLAVSDSPGLLDESPIAVLALTLSEPPWRLEWRDACSQIGDALRDTETPTRKDPPDDLHSL